MIDLSEVVLDSDFAQTFTLTRSPGEWTIGDDGIGFYPDPETVTLYGVVQPAKRLDCARLKRYSCRVRQIVAVYDDSPIAIEKDDLHR